MTSTTTSADLDAGRVLPEIEAARRCGLSAVHFARLRKEGIGPRFVQLGIRRVGYRLGDIDAWIEARLQGKP